MNLVIDALRVPLSDFDLEVTAHLTAQVTGIYGASGAGKTSLLDTIAGLRRISDGHLELGGTTFDDMSRRVHLSPRLRSVGYVPQENALFPHLSAGANVRYGMRHHDEATLEHVIDVLEIRALLGRSVRTLSGGEQKRIALARALVASPRLLLLDEPLSGIDRTLRDRILELLRRIRDEFGIPMLYVTHSPDELQALATETLVLDRGRVSAFGATPDVLA